MSDETIVPALSDRSVIAIAESRSLVIGPWCYLPGGVGGSQLSLGTPMVAT